MQTVNLEILAISLLSTLYFAFILYHIIGWLKLSVYKSENLTEIQVSIIIAARNEENNIANIITDIKLQNYSKSKYELLIIDDNSTDKTFEIASKLCNDNISIYKLEKGEGKKSALDYGIHKAKNNLILTTDADCRLNKNWINTFAKYYKEYKPVYISAPVVIEQDSFFESLQSVEFLSLNAIGASAIANKSAIFSNGANLAFEKNKYLELNDAFNNNLASGDDVFFLHKLKKKYSKDIAFLKSTDAIVRTKASESFSEFINQRKRWVSKSKSYKDFSTIFSGFIVFFINISISLLLIISIFNPRFLVPFLILFATKTIVDYTFLLLVNRFHKIKNTLLLIPFIELLYIFYVPIITIYSSFGGFSWKGRVLKKR